VRGPSGTFTVIGVHLSAPIDAAARRARNQQLTELAGRAAAVQGPLIVAGDFNTTPYSPYFADWLEAAGVTDSRRGRTISTSWPTMLPWAGIPIDHVAVNDGFLDPLAPPLAQFRVGPFRRARRSRVARRGAPMSGHPTACVLIIGNEILSGKTQDTNLQFLGFELAKLGIRLAEARVVRDEPAAIIRHLNEARREFTYVFTTGGIGPTHDDITGRVRRAGVRRAARAERRRRRPAEARRPAAQRARLKMARVPRGAELVENPVSNAPGFASRTCSCSRAFRASRARCLRARSRCSCKRRRSCPRASTLHLRESDFAEALEAIPAPSIRPSRSAAIRSIATGRFGATLVSRGTDRALLARVVEEIVAGDDEGSAARRTCL
jgi:molybdopterin-biosynthesis enzyme MoeA-like protein